MTAEIQRMTAFQKIMNQERIQKAMETKRQNKEAHAEQKVTIDENWTIQRVDPLNWEIRYKDKFNGFYGTIVSALNALPAKMLSEEAKGTLKDVQTQQKAILERIEMAYHPV